MLLKNEEKILMNDYYKIKTLVLKQQEIFNYIWNNLNQR